MIRESTTTINDLETRYLHGGSGEHTVVFLHDGAWGASSDVTWGAVLPSAAADGYRVIAPDLLGFGGSAKSVRLDQSPFGFRVRHVFGLLDDVGVSGPVHLVGNSFGGSLALRALTDPEMRSRIASVTTISGTGGPWRSAASAQLGPFDGTEEDMHRIVDLLCGDYDGMAEQVTARLAWAREPGHYAATMAIHQTIPEPLQVARPADLYPAPLGDVSTPVLLFECLDDVLVDVGWTKHLVDLMPQARVVEVPRRHAPNITHPEQTWATISTFLQEVADA